MCHRFWNLPVFHRNSAGFLENYYTVRKRRARIEPCIESESESGFPIGLRCCGAGIRPMSQIGAIIDPSNGRLHFRGDEPAGQAIPE
jgi:hypothetical protein